MRARVAYISSLGTTAILVAAALLMLAVVGAIVAFRGWPGAANAAGVQSVPLTPSLPRARASLVSTSVRPTAVVRARPGAVAARARRLSTVGLVKQVGPSVVPGLVSVRGAPPMHPVFPQAGRPSPTFPAPSGRDPAIGPLAPATPDSQPLDPARIVPVQLPNPAGSPPPTIPAVDAAVPQVPPPGLPGQ